MKESRLHLFGTLLLSHSTSTTNATAGAGEQNEAKTPRGIQRIAIRESTTDALPHDHHDQMTYLGQRHGHTSQLKSPRGRNDH
jgi:hypothetical protein